MKINLGSPDALCIRLEKHSASEMGGKPFPAHSASEMRGKPFPSQLGPFPWISYSTCFHGKTLDKKSLKKKEFTFAHNLSRYNTLW